MPDLTKKYRATRVTRRRYILDDYNRSTIEDVSMVVRLEQDYRTVRNTRGEFESASWVMFAGPDEDIQPEDRFILGDVASGEEKKEWGIITLYYANGFGKSHIEIVL